jgi:hypothetical protein
MDANTQISLASGYQLLDYIGDVEVDHPRGSKLGDGNRSRSEEYDYTVSNHEENRGH